MREKNSQFFAAVVLPRLTAEGRDESSSKVNSLREEAFGPSRPGPWADDQYVEYGPEWELTARIAQAQGMVSVQADCTLSEALRLMNDRATVTGRTLDEIVTAVLDRTIRFGE